jgi:integrase
MFARGDTMKLDAKTVAALELGGKADAIFFDETLPGFGYRLRLSAGGKVLRSWVVQYRRAGTSRRLLLGPAEVLGAEQARGMAKRALGRVANGEDPQGDKVERRGKDKLSLRGVVEEYLSAKEARVRARTFREVRRYLTGPYFKPLHGMPVDKVTRRDIASRLVAVERERGSITAARARAALSAFYVWAMTMGIVEANPVIGVVKPQDAKERERVLSDDELAAIWRACEDDDYGRIIRLLILTGCRRQEGGGIVWSEIDPDKSTWTIPGSRTKNGRAHTLPLMPLALDIIEGVPHLVSREQLFGTRGAGFNNWHKAKVALDARSGVRDWTVHDIRRTCATGLGHLGVQPHIIEQILNHQSGHKAGVAGVYNKSPYANEVRNALALWADHVRTLVEGGERKVLPLKVSDGHNM